MKTNNATDTWFTVHGVHDRGMTPPTARSKATEMKPTKLKAALTPVAAGSNMMTHAKVK